MEKWTGYKEKDLKSAIDDLKQFALEVNPKFLSTLKYKFQKDEYLNVANLPFNFWSEFSSSIHNLFVQKKTIDCPKNTETAWYSHLSTISIIHYKLSLDCT